MPKETLPVRLTDYGPDAVREAVARKAIRHGGTTAPIYIGGGLLALGFLVKVPYLLLLSGGLILLGVAHAAFRMVFGREAAARQYIEELNRRQRRNQQNIRKELEQGLWKCARIKGARPLAQTGQKQVRKIEEKFRNVQELLDMKLVPSELTYGRFLGAAEQVSLSVLDNLRAVTGILTSAGSIDPEYINRQLQALAAAKDDPEAGAEAADLEARLALRESQLAEARRILAKNEAAMTELEKISAAIAAWEGNGRLSRVNFEDAIERLKELARGAHEYNGKTRG